MKINEYGLWTKIVVYDPLVVLHIPGFLTEFPTVKDGVRLYGGYAFHYKHGKIVDSGTLLYADDNKTTLRVDTNRSI